MTLKAALGIATLTAAVSIAATVAVLHAVPALLPAATRGAEGRPGPQGPAGPRGERGARGPAGAASSSGGETVATAERQARYAVEQIQRWCELMGRDELFEEGDILASSLRAECIGFP